VTDYAGTCRRAADLIAERGHCKEVYEDADGHLCLSGAIRAALLEKLGAQGIYSALLFPHVSYQDWEDILNAMDRVNEDSVVRFNDSPGTSAEDVILLLKRSAEILEDEHDRS
jgi:hypothetical protein